jgi:hypothetical protein
VRPSAHSWQLICDKPGLTVDEQITELIVRLEPARAAIRDLTAGDGVAAVLQVVRYFNDESGEEEDLAPSAKGMERVSGQHQLLGWHLDPDTLAFLADIRADFDVDEYG